MPFFTRDGLSFHYREAGQGTAVVFQHGLGGDVGQPFSLVRPPPGFRLLAFDCRGHGETRPLGDVEKIGIAPFADDLAAFLDHLGVERAVIGGISMGAAVAMNFALRYPGRLLGLVLSRPAWLDAPLPGNVRLFGLIARLIRQYGAVGGREQFRQSPEYFELAALSPDVANSALSQFDHPRAEETVVKLERIAADAPCRRLEELKSIAVPTLVMANRQDPVHPFEYGETLARTIPHAIFWEITAKSVSLERHAADVQRHMVDFLTLHLE